MMNLRGKVGYPALFSMVFPVLLPGCFTTERVTVERLRLLDRPAVVRIAQTSPRGRPEVVRGTIRPGDLGPATIRYRPLRHGPRSWVVRWGGWPLVYTAGKRLRYEPADDGDEKEVPLEAVESLQLEKYSWALTLLSLPITLPVGLIDFLVNHLRFGFDDVDARFDAFSRPPAKLPPAERISP